MTDYTQESLETLLKRYGRAYVGAQTTGSWRDVEDIDMEIARRAEEAAADIALLQVEVGELYLVVDQQTKNMKKMEHDFRLCRFSVSTGEAAIKMLVAERDAANKSGCKKCGGTGSIVSRDTPELLQCPTCSKGTWRFIPHRYDYVGDPNDD